MRYLPELARLEQVLAGAAGPRPAAAPAVPDGAPLLQTAAAEAVFARAERLVGAMARAVAGAALPPGLTGGCAALCRRLDADPRAARALLQAAVSGEVAGLPAFLAWKALAHALPPLDAGEWARPDCPACGAPPAMAQLREGDGGRERALSCGRCATQWRYRRIGCPYCGNDAVEEMGVLEPDEQGFRVDVCRRCGTYLKTNVGEGDALALADWTTLHLDAACAERGLRRAAPSLYAL